MIIKLPSAKQGFLGLERVVRRLIAEDGFRDSQAALKAIANYEKFFILIATHQTEPLTPSQEVDMVWQRHILDTKAYTQDCIHWAGSYIHRYQGSSSSSFERCVSLLEISDQAEWEQSSSSYAFSGLEVNINCQSCSSNVDEENLSELLERVKYSLQSQDLNILWVADALEYIDANYEQTLDEYKRFLKLLIAGNTPLTPSKLIDEFWHQHILDTTDYWRFCMRIAGRYIHHVPHYEKPHSFHTDSFSKTQVIYKDYFGVDAPEKVWSYMGESGGCGGCNSEPEPLYSVDSPTSVVIKFYGSSTFHIDNNHYTQLHPLLYSKGMSMELWTEFLGELGSVPQISWKEFIRKYTFYDICVIGFAICVIIGVWIIKDTSLNTKLSHTCVVLIFCFLSGIRMKNRVMNQKMSQQIISKYVDKFDEIGVKITVLQSYDFTTITIEAHL